MSVEDVNAYIYDATKAKPQKRRFINNSENRTEATPDY
jgi:hypothetical protein